MIPYTRNTRHFVKKIETLLPQRVGCDADEDAWFRKKEVHSETTGTQNVGKFTSNTVIKEGTSPLLPLIHQWGDRNATLGNTENKNTALYA